MKALLISVIIALATISIATGCEKPDYQHPLHRK